MIRCPITDGRPLRGRVDWIQVREKAMPARALSELARELAKG